MKICSRCIYDENTPGIYFDENGVCNFCHTHDSLCQQYPAGEEGKRHIQKMADCIREQGKDKKYDCIVGVSGGCDSSYLLHIAKKVMHLRPLAVHFNNTWNTEISEQNLKKVASALNVDVFEYKVDPVEYDDIYLSFFKAGVPDIEAPTDIALAATLNRAAEQFGIKYILEGHNFRTEGISPLGWLYMDGKYIESVHDIFGKIPLKTYPNMKLFDMVNWMVIRKIRKLRPLWYMDYQKEDIKRFLHDEYGWEWYGGHHLENKFTAFYHSYFMPNRYGIDCRSLGYAAQVRTQKMVREKALQLMQTPPHYEPNDLEYLKKRFNFDDKQFNFFMTQPHKTYKNYKTYKKTFERLRPFFWLMAKLNRIPYTFYMKYTKKQS
ncbi:N-acetyl sugar amidotransferase [Desulfovibrio piger]|uniref:N-acetyl sugar amidotransferase n=1 Tax=Desulfovibrio piger TaxID=901 RepID=UPI0019583164|nr:N-acetyl sugar amidotransferase [Desulfovibrio piger]MBM6893879.1 N-acetyl sugar amidotransferase [Desulfovibrio piger]